MTSSKFIYMVENCEFDYECPLDWHRLAITSDANIRHCATCAKDVRLCQSNDELDQAVNRGECVAVSIYTEEFKRQVTAWEQGLGPDPWEHHEVKMPLGLVRKK